MGKNDGPEPEQWMEIATCDRCGQPIRAGQVVGLNTRQRLLTHEGPDLCESLVIAAIEDEAQGAKGTPER